MRQTKRRIATRRKSSTRKMIKGGCWFTKLRKSVSRKSVSRKSGSRKSSSSSSSNSDENVNLNTKDLGKLNNFFIKDATTL